MSAGSSASAKATASLAEALCAEAEDPASAIMRSGSQALSMNYVSRVWLWARHKGP